MNFGYMIYGVLSFMIIIITIIIWINLPSKRNVICGLCKKKMKPKAWYVKDKTYIQKFICKNKKCRSEVEWKEPLIPPQFDSDTTKK